ncbi:hypothetical protein TNCV_1513091 [Trichonephila clavipes]|nr:hypothetical protein TNCV_1513091 [Trichonephila clavipes]
MLSDQCTWPWGHCLLFELGQAPTPRLAVIMVKREPAPFDNRRSLNKKNPVASDGVERMETEESPGWRELESPKERRTEIGVERKERR